MTRETSETIREPRKGHHLKASEYAALVRKSKAQAYQAEGYVEEGLAVSNDKDKSNIRWLQVQATEDIPAYSVFSADFDQDFDEPLRATAAPFGVIEGGSPCILLTNEHLDIPLGSWGWARVVGEYDTVILRHDGTAPGKGCPCGPKLDAYTVSESYLGLVCMGNVDADRIYAMRTPDPHGLTGIASGDITAYNPVSKELGLGYINVKYRPPGANVLDGAIDPAAGIAPWNVKVYNLCEFAIEAGTAVQADQVLGVGLVAQPCPCDCDDPPSIGSIGSIGSVGPSAGSRGGNEVQVVEITGHPVNNGDGTITFPLSYLYFYPDGTHRTVVISPLVFDACDCPEGSVGPSVGSVGSTGSGWPGNRFMTGRVGSHASQGSMGDEVLPASALGKYTYIGQYNGFDSWEISGGTFFLWRNTPRWYITDTVRGVTPTTGDWWVLQQASEIGVYAPGGTSSAEGNIIVST